MINPGSRLLCATCRTKLQRRDPNVRFVRRIPAVALRQRQPEYFGEQLLRLFIGEK